MTTKPVQRPYENTTMAVYLRNQIDNLGDLGINQREIALAAGYDKPNILSMFKRGETKVPLNKALALAKALRCDPSFFFRLAAQQPDMPISASEIEKIFPNSVSAGEMKIVNAIRTATGGDVDPTDEQLEAVSDVFRVKERRGVSPVPKSL
ncbi:helix-turn-helix domain-containing protein [Methylobacterium oryzae]|uniref:helix-turn-helix domain-containing protein n=1 Tax=Methylobacterium oryzae TaxID=334852 RepID=UPI001F4581B9|nr:helix-turn-helix transcriptional regulator [Methylobacterium oryzae]UIN38322.1 helix-turn-helix domain-containing protein [Methylobacterium oryzae]